MRNINLKAYAAADIITMCVLTVVLEVANALALRSFGVYFTISIMLTMSLIVLMRWNYFGLLPALLGAIVYCIAHKANGAQYAIYICGNLFVALNLLWFKKFDKSRFTELGFTAAFVATGIVAVILGRTLISLFFGANFWDTLWRFATTSAFNGVMTFVLIFIARKQNGFFEDQIAYIRRIQNERHQKKTLADINTDLMQSREPQVQLSDLESIEEIDYMADLKKLDGQ